jgi:hypothetical protein
MGNCKDTEMLHSGYEEKWVTLIVIIGDTISQLL